MKSIISIIISKKILVLADQLLYSGLNFVTTLCLARLLSPTHFGIYSTIILTIYLIISISNAFIIQPFQVAERNFQKSPSYANFLLLLQLIAVAATLFITYIIGLCTPYAGYHFLPLALIISGIVLHDYFRKYYLALNNPLQVLIIDAIVAISQLLLMIYLFRLGNSDLNQVLTGLGCSYSLAICFSVYVSKHWPLPIKDWSHFFIYHKKEGFWLVLVSFVQWGSANLFVASLGVFISIEALGAFRLVQSLFGVLNVLFQTFENYVLPNASRMYAVSVSTSKDYIKKISMQSALCIGLLLLALFIFSEEVMFIAAGHKYLPYSYVIKGMCVLYFILFIGYPVRLSIRMLLLNKSFFTGYLLAFLFSLLFFNSLLKYWQLNGVIIGLIINQCIMLLFWNYQLHLKKFYLWK